MLSDRVINLLLRARTSGAARVRRRWLNLLGAEIRGGRLGRVHVPRNPWDVSLDGAALDDQVVLLSTGERRARPRIRIGAGTYVNRYTMFDATEAIEVGRNCMIGPFCYITDHDHGTEPGRTVASQALVSAPVSIGDDCWLGAGVIVLKGVTIGPGAVVGAGAVVTKAVPAGAVVAGVPSRQLRWRSET